MGPHRDRKSAKQRSARPNGLRAGRTAPDAVLYAGACVLAKFPQAAGILRYGFNRVLKRQAAIIEYKDVRSSSMAS